MAPEIQDSLPGLLDTLTRYLTSAYTSVPDDTSMLPPKDGISLFDIKNEMFLSYLQNLVFLILLKLRNRRTINRSDGSEDSQENLDRAVIKKLVELRVNMERGVKHLEGDLSYQINKVLQAAEDASRAAVVPKTVTKTGKKTAAEASDAKSESEGRSDADSEDGGVQINDLQYRPNPAAFTHPSTTTESTSKSKDGVYRPPRITATAMPLPTIGGIKAKDARRNAQKSATMDEFISTEYSTVPIVEPSIGSGITSSRRTVSEREKREEKERREYEERNFVRLPKESKKERREKRKREGGSQKMRYGGEEWRSLGEGVERIERLTKKRRKAGGSAVLERSRKRKLEDGGSGALEIGQGFQKRVKTLDGKRGKKN